MSMFFVITLFTLTPQVLYQTPINKPFDFKEFSSPAGCLLFDIVSLINLYQILINKPFDFESFSCPAGSPP